MRIATRSARRSPRRPRSRIAGIVGAGALLLAACSGGESDATTTTDATATVPSTSVAPTTAAATAPTTAPGESAATTTDEADDEAAVEGSAPSTSSPVGTTPPVTTDSSSPATTAPGDSSPITTDDPDDVSVDSLDRAIITVDELEAAGLGGNWRQFIDRFDTSDASSEPAPCGLDVLEVPGSVYIDNEDQGSTDEADVDESPEAFVESREFEQILAPGAGEAGVQAIAQLADCEEFAVEFGGEIRTADVAIEGASSVAAVETTEDGLTLYWYFADFDGTLNGVFYYGPEADAGGVLAGLLTASSARL